MFLLDANKLRPLLANSEGLQALLTALLDAEAEQDKLVQELSVAALYDDEQTDPNNRRKPKALRALGAYEAIQAVRSVVEALKSTR